MTSEERKTWERKPSLEPGKYQKACQAKTDAIADLMTGVLKKATEIGSIKTVLNPVQMMLVL